MKEQVILQIIKKIYWQLLRDELKKLVADSSSQIDDIIVGLLDKILQCE